MRGQLSIVQLEPYRARYEREMAESFALDRSALEVGASRNLVYPGPRGRRGFPICEEPACRTESIGPFSYHCVNHWTEALYG